MGQRDGGDLRVGLGQSMAARFLRSPQFRMAAGCRLVLSTDAHDPHELQDMRYAVDVARRAGLEAGAVLNTRSLKDFLKGLRRARARAAPSPAAQ